jgi:hypothetical protein
MNAHVWTLAIMSNSPFILNFDYNHYVYNLLAMK